MQSLERETLATLKNIDTLSSMSYVLPLNLLLSFIPCELMGFLSLVCQRHSPNSFIIFKLQAKQHHALQYFLSSKLKMIVDPEPNCFLAVCYFISELASFVDFKHSYESIEVELQFISELIPKPLLMFLWKLLAKTCCAGDQNQIPEHSKMIIDSIKKMGLCLLSVLQVQEIFVKMGRNCGCDISWYSAAIFVKTEKKIAVQFRMC